MVVKRFFISISMLFLGALLLQAKNNVIDSGNILDLFLQTLLSLILIVALLPKA